MPPVLRPLADSRFADRIDGLLVAAREVRRNAYAPYSKFLVGAAVLTTDGLIHAGSNIEGVDYDVTHAEESSFSVMRANPSYRPVLIVAVGLREEEPHQLDAPVIPPCGKCRQKIYEWVMGTPLDVDVIITDPADGQLKLCSIRELLPLSFG